MTINDINNWSSLITVNYDGGLSGDFFATLLDNSIVSEEHLINFNNYNDKNRYSFIQNDAFNGNLKCLHYFFRNVNSIHEKDVFTRQLNVLYKQLHNTDCFITSDNIRKYCFDNFGDRFNRYRVASVHCVDKTAPALQYIFPNSKNIYVGTDNLNYKLISKFLFYYKTGVEFFKVNDDGTILIDDIDRKYKPVEESIKKLLETKHNQNYHNEFFIDIYKLIFENFNYSKDLSTFLSHHIILDGKQICGYKEKTVVLLNSFDIDVYKNYDYNELYSKIEQIILRLIEKSNV